MISVVKKIANKLFDCGKHPQSEISIENCCLKISSTGVSHLQRSLIILFTLNERSEFTLNERSEFTLNERSEFTLNERSEFTMLMISQRIYSL